LISFGPNVPWGAVSQFDCRRRAKMQGSPLWFRVYFAAIGWANRIGHAEFAEGQLADILDREGSPYPGQDVQKAITAAKRHGLIQPESGARCLVLPGHHFQKDGKGTGSCKVHNVRVS
jgi:hypothetical protein